MEPNLGNYPWLVGGDFNIVLAPHEKIGGQGWDRNGSLDFNACLATTGLNNMGYSGSLFT